MTDPPEGGDRAGDDDPEGGELPIEPGWIREERAYRGISRRLAAHYLRNLGGTLVDADEPVSATRVDGEGWRVRLRAETVHVAGSITLTEVTVTFVGEPAAIEELIPRFKRKAMRAGG